MAKRAQNGKFVKSTPKKAKLTKVVISAPVDFAKPVTYETYLDGSELEAFKVRMRNIYSADFGIDPDSVDVK